jgi:hypothetical protein
MIKKLATHLGRILVLMGGLSFLYLGFIIPLDHWYDYPLTPMLGVIGLSFLRWYFEMTSSAAEKGGSQPPR